MILAVLMRSIALAGLMGGLFCCQTVAPDSDRDKALTVQVEEVLSIGSLDDDVLFQWVGISTDRRSNIYVTDSLDYSVKKFDRSGRLIARAGGKGQGPGEFQAPRQLVYDDGFLYVTDQASLGLQVFDEELRFIKSIPLDFPVTDIQVTPGGRIAVIAFYMSRASELCFLSSGGVVENRIPLGRKKGNVLMDSADFIIDGSGNICLAFSFRDMIQKLKAGGEKLWDRSLFHIKSIKKTQIKQWVVPTEVIYMDCAVDKRGWLYVLGGYRAENRARDIYVLDQKGDWLTTFTLPDTTHCIHLDSQGFLYARANEGITLKKYRLRHEWKRE
jgi:hypothetical protein